MFHKTSWENKQTREGEIRHSNCNNKDFLQLGWEPKINIEQGLKSCFHRNLKKFI